MKILLMEKFDGISSQIPLWNGRDSRLKIINSSTVYTMNPSEDLSEGTGLLHCFNLTGDTPSGWTTSVKLNFDYPFDTLKKYSLCFNGLITTFNVTSKTSTHLDSITMKSMGIELDKIQVNRGGQQNYPLLNESTNEYNLELVYNSGYIDVFINGRLLYKKEMVLNSTILELSVSSTSTGRWGSYTNGGTVLGLKELVICELEEGESRVGNVRLERLPVLTTSENIPNPENITPVNLANNTYSVIGEDEVEVTVESPAISKHEKIVGIDYRTSAVSTIDGSQMRVRLLNGEEELHNKVEHIPQTHTRESSCQVIPAKYLGDNPEDYEDVKLVIKATEDEE